ncbi:hypothetical protein Ait01nite_047540 [Actinoplanes italicus]|uniref:Uncharacterized protein n=1 Tax=Actinoplanes italicus TaxID=113567 RepID=A0A2T0K9P5_9ACTN|nr:hypothetical protein [Actinoplanes italicus]PRX19857.1 hypothetical protein CLV67_109122 [Actinoplanes italicus]GIE31709.1 hypothetical protein Ait01nite_047540 [Actinoplanes italicus]
MRRGPVLHAIAGTVTAIVLAPLVLPGYVLRYDMVFVPRQPLSWEMVAPADELPRAVPLDAVVSAANLVMPGWLLQRIALVAIVYLAALGAARLLPTVRLLPKVVAAFAYAWTPYLAERLLLGQWALLLAYACLPWLVAAARDVRAGRRGALPRLVVAAAPAALTPTGGLIALVTVAVLLPLRRRVTGLALAAVAALNAPWLVAALTSPAGGASDPEGVAQFAARAENWAGSWVALAGTGGIWNAQTVPASRASVLVPLVTLLLLAVAVPGLRELRRRWPGGADRLFVLAAGGFLLALAGVLPTAALLEWAVVHVPGGGLLRDGQKFLIPYALVLALGFALGSELLAARLERRWDPASGRALLAAAALLPVILLPDLAFGAMGQLKPVRYPADWDVVAARVAERPGEVLSLPFEGYQRYAWTGGVVVRDPAPRYLHSPVLINDALRVGAVTVGGENPRASAVGALLAAGRPVSAAGTPWVLVRKGAQEPPKSVLSGLRLIHDGTYLQLWENPTAPAVLREADTGRRAAALAAHLLAAAVVLSGVFARLLLGSRSWYGPRTHESGEERSWPNWPRSSSRRSPGESSVSSECSRRSAP